MRITVLLLLVFCINFCEAQQAKNVDFLTCKAELMILPVKKEVRGKVNYSFKVKEDTDSIFIDAKNMVFDNVYFKKRRASFKVTNQKLWLFKKFKKNKEYTVSFNYQAHPKKAMYFIDWENQDHPEANPQVWTQGQGKDNSNWIPSFDDMNEKVEFDLSVTFDNAYVVITNGKLLNKEIINDDTVKWNYDMEQPMSSYLLAIAVGKYVKKEEMSKSGVPLEMYYYPKDSLKLEPTYRYSKQMVDFLEEEIGVPYPWQNYKQVPVKDFLYAGMENTSVTIFSDAFVVDSTAFVDKNYVNVNAHELSHQWFGNLVTETHGTHHWLQEGFATYYALLAEKEVFGDDYYYHKLYKTSQQIIKAQKTDTIPLMNPKASSLTFYQKGAWALHSLREQVGDSIFKMSVQQYLAAHQFKNVDTNDFISIVEKLGKQDLTEFVNTWLLSNKLPIITMFESLKKNNVIDEVIKLDEGYHSKLISESHEYIKAAFIRNFKIDTLDRTKIIRLHNLFKIGEPKVRQLLADKFNRIPKSLQAEYETLLYDKSYKTIETALLSLWVNFQEDRKQYLDKTEKIIGFNDKNIRTLWLALALNTKGFEKTKYMVFYDELVGYTNPVFHFEVRKNAFEYLNELQLVNSTVLQNLQQATKHHNWRFRSYCKKMFNHLKN
ncbi:MAG: aminopeptidase [Kordia sp.]|nr:MAG: aminopeptidase [Kordia sp.]